MALIPQETIQEIIEKVDIVDWIEQYVPLQRSSGNFKGLCPFHSEKTPSFNVRPSNQSFHCFGCGESGTVIGFVMKYENLSFPEAARRLAEKAGVTIIEEAYDPKQAARRKKRDEILKLQTAAADFYQRLLFKDRSADAQKARDYLTNRGLSGELAREWKLGYAPEDSRLFFTWASQERIPTELLVEGGLAAWRDENYPGRGCWLRFRHRLMFPVMDENSNIIAFSGRVLEKDQKGGKYVNSPETMIFNKSKTFYGFHKSRRPITKSGLAIVCEGQIDLISAFEAGIENIVAPLGTAFTEEHAKVLRRQCEEVTLCFDSDNAGIAAAGKAFRLLAPKGMLVRLALLPEGEDPDSYIKKYGVDAFQSIINNSSEYFDFHIDRKGSRLSAGPLRDRLDFAKELSADIALVENKMLQDSLINRIAAKLGVGEAEIRKQIAGAAKIRNRAEKNQKIREARDGARQEANGNGKVAPVVIENRSIRLLCRLLLTDPMVKNQFRNRPIPEFFADIPGTELLAWVWQGDFDPTQPASVHAFVAVLPEGEQGAIKNIMNESFPGATGDWAAECMRALEKQALQNKITMVKARMGVEDLPVDEVTRLTKELLDLQARRHDIETA
ncbi:MAG: DNA primase [Verrucomicrobiales bacterium]|nr:DNA primase [Verrucomicrobiales bacterium]